MYNASTIKTSLITLVGWRQNYDADGTQLSELTTTDSGLYFNDEHPLLTIDNLLSIAPEFARVSNPTASGNFTAWLKQRTEQGVIRAVQSWFNHKFPNHTAKNLLENQYLFETAVNSTEKDSAGSDLVGFEFVPIRSKNTIMKIEQIGVQFDTNGTFDIKLFNSEAVNPEQTEPVTYTGGGALQWVTVNWELNGRGAYYVAYDQSSAPGQSINAARDYTYHKQGISKSPGGQYFKATAFKVDSDGSTIWDQTTQSYQLDTNYGLNFRISVMCDYTSLITEQKDLFKTAISKQVAIDLLKDLAYNAAIRVNRHESNVRREDIMFDIEGDPQGRKTGLKYELDQAIKNISLDTTGIDSVCLPCKRRGVKIGSI